MGNQPTKAKAKQLRRMVLEWNWPKDDIVMFLSQNPELQTYLSNPDMWGPSGLFKNPFFVAVYAQRLDIIELLIEDYHIPVDSSWRYKDTYSLSALMTAVIFDRQESVRALIHHGADIDQGGVWDGVHFENALHLDRLVRNQAFEYPSAPSRDDSMKKLLEEETKRSRGGERAKIKKG